jgi:hypothetical protein
MSGEPEGDREETLFFPPMFEGYDFTDVSRRALAESGVVVAFRPAVNNAQDPAS